MTHDVQQDHASAQSKQLQADALEEFKTVRDEYASQLGLPPPLPTIDIHCGDHARANVGEAATKAAHEWLESKIGDQKEPSECGDNILEQLMRVMDLEIDTAATHTSLGVGFPVPRVASQKWPTSRQAAVQVRRPLRL